MITAMETAHTTPLDATPGFTLKTRKGRFAAGFFLLDSGRWMTAVKVENLRPLCIVLRSLLENTESLLRREDGNIRMEPDAEGVVPPAAGQGIHEAGFHCPPVPHQLDGLGAAGESGVGAQGRQDPDIIRAAVNLLDSEEEGVPASAADCWNAFKVDVVHGAVSPQDTTSATRPQGSKG